jgi:hypothetical protein
MPAHQTTTHADLSQIMELVTNRTGRGCFELGYTIVCNRRQSDLGITHDERNAREAAFFRTSPWSATPKQRTGVTALKGRLNNLAVTVTSENFQAVAVDVRNKIRKREPELGDLGPARVTSNGQRNHLIKIASEFREITVKVIDAYYGRDRCFEDDDAFRLATNVMEMNRSFSETIRLNGVTRTFRRSDGEESGLEAPSSSDDTPSTPASPSRSGSGNYFLSTLN